MRGRRAWPDWLEPLRPDELARRRLHKRIMAAAEGRLRRPDRSWQDVSASWSAFLTPLAAGLAVAFGTLAYRASAPHAGSIAGAVAARESVAAAQSDITPLLGADAEPPPALLIDGSEVSREAVLRAALVSR